MTDYCYSSQLLNLSTALERIYSTVLVLKGDEIVNLKTAHGRVLTENCLAPFNLPAFPNSAMDGYAFNSADIQNTDFNLIQSSTSWAGHPAEKTLEKGHCVRIFTGAAIPKGADSVIMQEQVQANDTLIHFPENTQAKQNIRSIGEDLMQHDCLLSAPKKITAVDLGLLASAGIYEINVKRKIRIAFFSTGDELCTIGKPLKSGGIYDSNRYLLTALLSDVCHEVIDLGVMPDNKASIQQCLLNAAQNHDVIISTGGVSVGDADYIQEILHEIGQVNFWKLAIKPGKPIAFGCIQQCYFFGLPGNPISALTSFQQVVSPALHHMTGLTKTSRIQLPALCKSQLYKQPGRQEFQRGILSRTPSGEFEVISSGKQGSNILSTSSRANCYIVLSREQANVEVGEQVMVEPFSLSL